MKCHRIEELIELMQPEWQKNSELNLIQFVIKLAKEAGYKGDIEDLTDDTLIYHLKMCNLPTDAVIPGLAKDYEADFKTAIFKARGITPK